MTAGVLISCILPVFSSIILLTRLSTRYVRPQYGTISASHQRPRFLLPVFSVLKISSCDFTRTSSPSVKFRVSVGVWEPQGITPALLGNLFPARGTLHLSYNHRIGRPTPMPAWLRL